MPLTLSQIQSLRRNSDLINRIEVALAITSLAVAQEPAETENHANRAKLVAAVAADSGKIVNRMATIYAVNARQAAAPESAVADEAVETYVANVFAHPPTVALFLRMVGETPEN